MRNNQGIFKEYDVRGIYPKELNKKTAREIARMFANFLKAKQRDKIIIARDKRPSSLKIVEAVISELNDYGIDTIDLGITSSPILYWSVPYLRVKGGIMITASHNPQKYNGMKFIRDNGEPIGGKELKCATEKIKTRKTKTKGVTIKKDITKEYLNTVLDGEKEIKIKIPAFFDYDADRLMIKNKKGKIMRGDIIGGIIADAILKKGDITVCDLRCSKALFEYLKNKGIKTIMSKVGHFHVKKLMREKDAIFGIEITGHYYFKKFHYCESPLYALEKLKQYLKKTEKKIEKLAEPFMKYGHSGVLNFQPKNRKTTGSDIEKITKELKEKYRTGAQGSLDGLTVEFSNWWFNIRQSNTESIIRVVIETKNPKILKEKIKEITDYLISKNLKAF